MNKEQTIENIQSQLLVSSPGTRKNMKIKESHMMNPSRNQTKYHNIGLTMNDKVESLLPS